MRAHGHVAKRDSCSRSCVSKRCKFDFCCKARVVGRKRKPPSISSKLATSHVKQSSGRDLISSKPWALMKYMFLPRTLMITCRSSRGSLLRSKNMSSFCPTSSKKATVLSQVHFKPADTCRPIPGRVHQDVHYSTILGNSFLRFIKVPLIIKTSWPRSKIF